MRAAGALVLILAVTACGGAEDAPEAAPSDTPSSVAEPTATEEAATEPPAQEAELEASYRTYVKAFLTGDGATAYALLSKRCRDLQPLSEFAAISESAAEVYGEVDYTIESVTVDGDRGTLDATYAVEALNQGGGSEWVLEGGEWRTDKCD